MSKQRLHAPMLKVCGVTSTRDVTPLAEAGADLVGLWHGVPGGHADLPLLELGRLAGAARAVGLEPVLVTFSRNVATLSTALRMTGIRWVQLHAYQPPATVAAIRAALPGSLTVIKVLHVAPSTCVEEPLLGAYERFGTDIFLLDSVNDGRIGSTGKQIDADRALTIIELTRRPFLIAGGISAHNPGDYTEIAAHPSFYGIDVDTAARDTAGSLSGEAVRDVASAWGTAGHIRGKAV